MRQHAQRRVRRENTQDVSFRQGLRFKRDSHPPQYPHRQKQQQGAFQQAHGTAAQGVKTPQQRQLQNQVHGTDEHVHHQQQRRKGENGQGAVNITQRIQYRNLKEVIDQVPFMIPYLKQAIESVGLTPQTEPFRGGTDGSALSHRGLPCPNLSAGYENAHGRFEYVPVQSMEKNVEILLNLIDIYAKCDC